MNQPSTTQDAPVDHVLGETTTFPLYLYALPAPHTPCGYSFFLSSMDMPGYSKARSTQITLRLPSAGMLRAAELARLDAEEQSLRADFLRRAGELQQRRAELQAIPLNDPTSSDVFAPAK